MGDFDIINQTGVSRKVLPISVCNNRSLIEDDVLQTEMGSRYRPMMLVSMIQLVSPKSLI